MASQGRHSRSGQSGWWSHPIAIAGMGLVAVVAVVVAVLVWVVKPDHPTDSAPGDLTQVVTSAGPVPTVDEPVVTGSLSIPNTLPDRIVPQYEAAPKAAAASLTVPIVSSSCPIEKDGSIGAPRDYTTACIYNAPEGGQAVLSHSVRGPRTGVFDNLAQIPVGSQVTINGHTYTVDRVDIFAADELPQYLWEKGHLSLITCTLEPIHDVDPSAPWSKTTVVTLKES